MKTHVEAPKHVPSRPNTTWVPNSLAHYEQYRQAMRRAGVQPRLETDAPQSKRVETNEHTPSNIPIFEVDFSGNMQLLNLQNRPEANFTPYVWIPPLTYLSPKQTLGSKKQKTATKVRRSKVLGQGCWRTKPSNFSWVCQWVLWRG